MGKFLSMPAGLRNEQQVVTMITAYMKGDLNAFCAADQARIGDDINETVSGKLQQARGGNKGAAHSLWMQFLDIATDTAIGIGPITDPDVETLLDNARSHDPRIEVLREKAKSGDPEAKAELRTAQDDEDARHIEARDALFEYLQGLVDSYRENKLYLKGGADTKTQSEVVAVAVSVTSTDGNASPASPEAIALPLEAMLIEESDADDESVDDSDSKLDFRGEWGRLAETIGGSAERVWRDGFLRIDAQLSAEDRPAGLERTAEIAHRLMLLWLEASLYRERAYYNQIGRYLSSDGTTNIRKLIADLVAQYRATIKRWDKELFEATHFHYFVPHGEQSQQLRGLQLQQLHRLIQQFSNLDTHELGWASQVSDVRAELRYQLRDEIRREKLSSWRLPTAIGLFILKYTTGYGTRPIRFLYTALAILGLDALAFFLNDLFNPRLNPTAPVCAMSHPQIHQWTDVLSLILHYLYVAATTLTSLGSDSALATYCGGASTQIILIASTVTGYFMLGLLGALLYTQLTQRD